MATLCPRFSRMILISRTDLILSMCTNIRACVSIFSSENMMVISIFYFSTDHRIWVLYCVAEMLFRRAGQRLWWTTHGLFFLAGEQDRSFLLDSSSCQFMFFMILLLLFIHLFLYISSHLYTPNQYIRTVKWCAKLSGRRGTAWISPSATFSLKLGLKKNKVCNANLLPSGILFVRVIWKSRWIFFFATLFNF